MTFPLLVINGPTGSGKSGLAVKLASEYAGEVINCDSLQVYRHFNIGSAKLPEAERGGIPHHLIDAVNAEEGFTAGDFQRLGRNALQEISGRGHLPIVAGGTGFYLRALIDGLSPGPPRDESLRAKLRDREMRREGSLHRILTRLDPVAAQRIHAHDTPKLIRALEIRQLSATKASEQPARDPLQGYRVLKLGLFPPRAELYRVLDLRCAQMFQGGLLEEIATLLDQGVPRYAKPFESLGYKEGLAAIEGRMGPVEALEQMQRDTRRYAKRQMTWFRRESELIALAGFGSDVTVMSTARELTAALIAKLN